MPLANTIYVIIYGLPHDLPRIPPVCYIALLLQHRPCFHLVGFEDVR